MGLRDRLGAAADRAATVVSSVFVTAPDHPNRGGLTGGRSATDGEDSEDGHETGGSERDNGQGARGRN